MQHGKCSTIPAGSGSVSVPFLVEGTAAAQQFEASSVNFTRTSCTDGFNELFSSSDWSDGLCFSASTHLCLAGSGPELIRIVAEISGASTMSTSLYVDDKPAAWFQQQDWKQRGLASSVQAVDTLLLLSGRCHKVAIVFDDGVSTEVDEDDSTSHRNKVHSTTRVKALILQ